MTLMPSSLVFTQLDADGGGKFVSRQTGQNGVRLPSAEFQRHPRRATRHFAKPCSVPAHPPETLAFCAVFGGHIGGLCSMGVDGSSIAGEGVDEAD